jgi:hypothetical protein
VFCVVLVVQALVVCVVVVNHCLSVAMVLSVLLHLQLLITPFGIFKLRQLKLEQQEPHKTRITDSGPLEGWQLQVSDKRQVGFFLIHVMFSARIWCVYPWYLQALF